jgi:hypothetical protein
MSAHYEHEKSVYGIVGLMNYLSLLLMYLIDLFRWIIPLVIIEIGSMINYLSINFDYAIMEYDYQHVLLILIGLWFGLSIMWLGWIKCIGARQRRPLNRFKPAPGLPAPGLPAPGLPGHLKEKIE